MRTSREVAGESSAHEDPLEQFPSDDEDPLAKEMVISVLNDQLRNPIKSLDRLLCIPCSPSEPCELCGCLEDPLKMLICDRCEKAFHLSCCNPKVNKLEGDDWICELCENRIGKDFQVDVPEWSSANSINQYDDEPLEMAPSSFTGLNVKELNFKKANSLGNWIQCQGKVKDENGQVIICGKWRRAPLFIEQSKKWDCSCAIIWDPLHADCVVPQDLDIAIVKATNHVECPPKERHVRKIFAATSVSRPRADVAYCIYALARRLSKTRNWAVALKTLIVIHRTLREGDPTFREEMLNYSHRGHILQISNFKDDSSPLAWDCSAWVRTYALFLEERLECFRVLRYDIEAERLLKNPQGATKGHSRTRTLCCPDLLEQLPALQQLLYRLVNCQPEGGACGNYLIQYALALILKESFKIYCAINDGIINLVDMFFEMSKFDAVKALEIYKRAGQQAEILAEFYEFCKALELARNFQFPTLRQPPPSFLATMEEYIKEAPRVGSSSSKNLEYEEKNLLTYKDDEEEAPPETHEPAAAEEKQPDPEPEEQPPEPIPEPEPEPEPPATTGDLLGLEQEVNPVAAEIEQNNALALAIMQPGDVSKPSTGMDLLAGGSSGWELALVATPSNNTNHVVESKLAGGFDKLLLNSLYEDTARQQQIASFGYYGSLETAANPFNTSDPFAMSNSISPPPNVQMALMQQQQQQQYYQQQYYQQQYYQQQQLQQQQQQQQQNMMMMVPYGQQPQNPSPQPIAPNVANPFGDPFSGLAGLPQSAHVTQRNSNLL